MTMQKRWLYSGLILLVLLLIGALFLRKCQTVTPPPAPPVSPPISPISAPLNPPTPTEKVHSTEAPCYLCKEESAPTEPIK